MPDSESQPKISSRPCDIDLWVVKPPEEKHEFRVRKGALQAKEIHMKLR